MVIAACEQATADHKSGLILPSKTFRPEIKKSEVKFSFAYTSTSPVTTFFFRDLAPQTKLQTSRKWNMKHCKSVEFLSIL